MSERLTQKQIDELFRTHRWCYYIPPDSLIEGHGFRVSIVFENVAGHFPMGNWPYTGKGNERAPWFWGPSLEDAQKIANQQNWLKLNLNKEQAARIVTSSMAADRRGKRRR